MKVVTFQLSYCGKEKGVLVHLGAAADVLATAVNEQEVEACWLVNASLNSTVYASYHRLTIPPNRHCTLLLVRFLLGNLYPLM